MFEWFLIWIDHVFSPKFEYRYDKTNGDFITVPLDELEDWDKKYAERLKDKGMEP